MFSKHGDSTTTQYNIVIVLLFFKIVCLNPFEKKWNIIYLIFIPSGHENNYFWDLRGTWTDREQVHRGDRQSRVRNHRAHAQKFVRRQSLAPATVWRKAGALTEPTTRSEHATEVPSCVHVWRAQRKTRGHVYIPV